MPRRSSRLKRPAEATQSPETSPKQRKRAKKASDNEASDETKPGPKPRLKISDLEFDYDRTQLRDQRPTPGRVNRPRLTADELDEDFRNRFHIPQPVKPKLMSEHDSRWGAKKALADPTDPFHDLYVCHKKGPNGSPTYDSAGYQLDWKKVDKWMKPKGYSKHGVVNGMNRALKEAMEEEELLYRVFFVGAKGPEGVDADIVKHYIKDHISKDLGVPWHQIKKKKILEWEKKQFPKQKASEWWRRPNEEEEKRKSKMMMGASLRKDL